MQFLVTAKDGTDDDAVERRKRVRPTHLEAIAPLVEDGHVLVGGAILNDDGDMIGSMLLVEFPDRSGVDAWLERDPYVTGDVWRDIDVRPFRAAVGSWQP
jgi:uncharacterized protein YciI